MEKDYDDIITIDGEDYVIVDELIHDGNNYIYVINSETGDKVSILKETEENGEKYIESIPSEKIEYFMGLFARKFIKETKANQES